MSEPCRPCNGDGQRHMTRDGQPLVCEECGGKGCVEPCNQRFIGIGPTCAPCPLPKDHDGVCLFRLESAQRWISGRDLGDEDTGRVWPADEGPIEHLKNGLTILMCSDRTPSDLSAVAIRIERAIALLELQRRENDRNRRGLDCLPPSDWDQAVAE